MNKITRRNGFILSFVLFLIGVACLAQAQVPMTGAGKGTPTTAFAVTVNATGSEKFQALGASLSYTGITVAAGTNTALLCVLQRAAGVLDVTAGVSFTWDSGGTNQAMTQLATANFMSIQLAQIWGLRAPTTGNKTLAVAWTNAAADNFVACVAFDHVLQTNDGAAFPHTTSNNAGASNVAVTSVSGNVVVGSMVGTDAGTAALGTTIYNDITNGALVNAAADYLFSTTTSTTVGMVANGTDAIVGVDVQAGP